MSSVEYCTILEYRRMIPLFPIDEICRVCLKTCLHSFGEHTIHYRELLGLTTDMIWLGMSFLTYSSAPIFSAKKEAPVNFLTDQLEGRSTLRSANILVFGWIGGKIHVCGSNKGFSLVGLRVVLSWWVMLFKSCSGQSNQT
ncbi:hypothetical protein HanRHA438_Chr03g0141121 [Helianthus annuus]|nr:hypothetical protein HanRHA438_Chr03g0141121 [Helianthus annuus]